MYETHDEKLYGLLRMIVDLERTTNKAPVKDDVVAKRPLLISESEFHLLWAGLKQNGWTRGQSDGDLESTEEGREALFETLKAAAGCLAPTGILLVSGSSTAITRLGERIKTELRLDIIERTQDGFQLAEEDLKLRGPGEFFGTRQSGLPDLRMVKLSDVALLEMARNEAINLFQIDPNLAKAEHHLLAQELIRVWPKVGEWS